jgi:Short C-terminal domain
MRTAAVVGTAAAVGGAVSHHQQQRYAEKDAEQYQQEQQQYAQAAPAPAPVAAAPAGPDYDELTKLAQLHEQGILTDDEFAAKKAQILGI